MPDRYTDSCAATADSGTLEGMTPMTCLALAVPLLLVGLSLSSCGDDDGGAGDAHGSESTTTPTDSPSDAVLQPTTARGLAAAVFTHFDGYEVLEIDGGYSEDPPGLSVFLSIRTGAVRALVSVTVSESGDGLEGGKVGRGPAFSDGNPTGYTVSGSGTHKDGSSVLLFAEVFGPAGLTVAQGQALVDDELIAPITDPAMNAAGEELEQFHDETESEGDEGEGDDGFEYREE